MNKTLLNAVGTAVLALIGCAIAQQVSKHILSADELKKVVPTEYFFRGQKAPVQLRNAVGFQLADTKMMLAALVDASGYSTAIQQKYQGLLVTESKLNFGGSSLPAGQYGFGFSADGRRCSRHVNPGCSPRVILSLIRSRALQQDDGVHETPPDAPG